MNVVAHPSCTGQVRRIDSVSHRSAERLTMRYYRDASEVSRINDGLSTLLEASPELMEVLRIGAELEVLSRGAFSCHERAGPAPLGWPWRTGQQSA